MAAKKNVSRAAAAEASRLKERQEFARIARSPHHIAFTTARLIETMVFTAREATRGVAGLLPQIEDLAEKVEGPAGFHPDAISALNGDTAERALLLEAHLRALRNYVALPSPGEDLYINALWECFLSHRLGSSNSEPVTDRRARFLTALDRYARTGDGGVESLLEFFARKTPELPAHLERLAKAWPDNKSGPKAIGGKWKQLEDLFRETALKLSAGKWRELANDLGLTEKWTPPARNRR